MSQPAARQGDMTSHGGVITIGEPTVLIANRAAARMGDMHTCSMSTPVPHVGGPILQGRAMVLIGDFPAAAVRDIVNCVPMPDIIITGCPSVLIGDLGAAPAGGGSEEPAPRPFCELCEDEEAETVRFEYRLLDRDLPIRDASCTLFVDDQQMEVTSDGDGVVSADIPANATTAYLMVEQDPPAAPDAPPPAEAGEQELPSWTGSGGDYIRPATPGAEPDHAMENRLEIPIILGQLEPLDPSAGVDDAGNRAAAKKRLVQLGFMDRRHHVTLGAAILDFQISQDLEPTGQLDTATCSALNDFAPAERDEP